MKKVFLHGYLGEKFGKEFCLDVQNPPEAIRALSVQIPGFEQTIREGEWHVVRGRLEDWDADDEDRLLMGLDPDAELHFLPAIAGAGDNGIVSAILGIVLIVVGYFFYPPLIGAGIGLLVGGIIQMTMKVPGADTGSGEGADDRASFLFAGPRNQSTQGVAIPRGYGRMWSGSVVVSVGLYAEQLTA